VNGDFLSQVYEGVIDGTYVYICISYHSTRTKPNRLLQPEEIFFHTNANFPGIFMDVRMHQMAKKSS